MYEALFGEGYYDDEGVEWPKWHACQHEDWVEHTDIEEGWFRPKREHFEDCYASIMASELHWGTKAKLAYLLALLLEDEEGQWWIYLG